MRLEWEFLDDGNWEARSCCCATEDGDHFHYRIGMMENGLFDVSESDEELAMGGEGPTTTLAEAKAICNSRELEIANEAKSSQRRNSNAPTQETP